jgi:hypothetical protein
MVALLVLRRFRLFGRREASAIATAAAIVPGLLTAIAFGTIMGIGMIGVVAGLGIGDANRQTLPTDARSRADTRMTQSVCFVIGVFDGQPPAGLFRQ